MAQIIKKKSELIKVRNKIKQNKIGFVPTMGNLHQGHLSLMKNLAEKSDLLFISIFVNPTQFGPNEDFNNYPRTLEKDLELIISLNLNIPVIVFAPENMSEVYPEKFHTTFSIPSLDNCLCGSSRPGHFNGVLSVIFHLFNLVKPTIAIFGQKDYQQYLIIKSFCQDFFPSINIEMSPIIRESNGLALSSRNGYLNSFEKIDALYLHQKLLEIKNDLEKKSLKSIELYKVNLENLQWDYLEILDAENLKTPTIESKKFLIAGALFVHQKVRIIDNIILEL